MADWLKRYELKKGQLAMIDVPEENESFALVRAPQDAVLYIFEDFDKMMRWVKKKNRVMPGAMDDLMPPQKPGEPQKTIPIQGIPPELLTMAQEKPSDANKSEEQLLKEAREKRLKKIVNEQEET